MLTPMHTYVYTHTHTHMCTHSHRTEGKDQAIAAFHKSVLSVSHAIMFRDKIDGSLHGVLTMNVSHFEKYTIIKLGWGLFKNYYRGGPFPYLASGYFFLRGIVITLYIKTLQLISTLHKLLPYNNSLLIFKT